jgi:hypothetical protein
MSAASQAWAKRNPEKVKEHKRRYRQRHAVRLAAQRAAEFQANKAKKYAERQKWIDANPEMVAAQAVRRRLREMHGRLNSDLEFQYNVTADQYARINEAQGGVCAICKKPNDTTRTKRLFVDHNHTTGRLRALLCHSCNAGLGYFREDPTLFLRAIAYLKAFEGEPEHQSWDDDAIAVLGRAGWQDFE